jgi:hypothetical protein
MRRLFVNRKNWKKLFATIGSLLIDLGKLAFGSLILGSVLNGGIDPFKVFVFGAVVTVLFSATGIFFILMSEGW